MSEELLRRLLGDDYDAWGEFVDAFSGVAAKSARFTFLRFSSVSLETDVEEAVSETFMSLLRNNKAALRALKAPYNFRAYVSIVASRKAIDLLRRKGNTIELRQTDGEEEDVFEKFGIQTNDAPQVDPEQVKVAMSALSKMPAKEQILIRSIILEGLAYKDAARLAGINPNSVGPTLVRAIGKLRALVKGDSNVS